MRWLFVLVMTVCGRGAMADFAEAEAAAKKFEVAPGYKTETVAAEPLLQNPVAFSIDERGRVFVAETHRLDNAVVDITKNTNWLRDDLALRTVPPAKSPPARSAQYPPRAIFPNSSSANMHSSFVDGG